VFATIAMAVSIRLRREGTKNRPFYRVVVADKRSPRDGKFLEVIGNYDPRKEGENYQLNLDRVEYWVKNGAQPSETVASMIRKAKKKAATAEA
jgi:small subunit ribosomal protein S16